MLVNMLKCTINKDGIFICFMCCYYLKNKDGNVFMFVCLWIKENKKGYYVVWVMYLIYSG